jgi:hypothetical protein
VGEAQVPKIIRCIRFTFFLMTITGKEPQTRLQYFGMVHYLRRIPKISRPDPTHNISTSEALPPHTLSRACKLFEMALQIRYGRTVKINH